MLTNIIGKLSLVESNNVITVSITEGNTTTSTTYEYDSAITECAVLELYAETGINNLNITEVEIVDGIVTVNATFEHDAEELVNEEEGVIDMSNKFNALKPWNEMTYAEKMDPNNYTCSSDYYRATANLPCPEDPDVSNFTHELEEGLKNIGKHGLAEVELFNDETVEVEPMKSNEQVISEMAKALQEAHMKITKLEAEIKDKDERLEKARAYYKATEPIVKQYKQDKAIANLKPVTQTVITEIKPDPKTVEQGKKVMVNHVYSCSCCNREITEKAAQYCQSKPEFEGKNYCFQCQKKVRKSKANVVVGQAAIVG